MSDERPSMSRRNALKATAGAAAATVATTGTAAAERASTPDVSVGDCLRVPRRITVYDSCTGNSGYVVSSNTSGTIEAIRLDGSRVRVDWDSPYLRDGYVDVHDVRSGFGSC